MHDGGTSINVLMCGSSPGPRRDGAQYKTWNARWSEKETRRQSGDHSCMAVRCLFHYLGCDVTTIEFTWLIGTVNIAQRFQEGTHSNQHERVCGVSIDRSAATAVDISQRLLNHKTIRSKLNWSLLRNQADQVMGNTGCSLGGNSCSCASHWR